MSTTDANDVQVTEDEASSVVHLEQRTARPRAATLPDIASSLRRPLASGLYRSRRTGWTPFAGPIGDDAGAVTPVPDGSDSASDAPAAQRPSPLRAGRHSPLPDRIRWRRRATVDELRLDVDGYHPQMVASGVVRAWLTGRLDWIAHLTRTGSDAWRGTISYEEGQTSLLPHTTVDITVHRSAFPGQQHAVVRFSGGAAPMVMTFRYESASFRSVEFEFDCEQGQTATTAIDTHAHPNRPVSLAAETLTIDAVYRRAGFHVRSSGGASIIPSSLTGADLTWSDQEMHDAMQVHWSRFADRALWSLWVLFARQHDMGPGLGGIMFDDLGPNHRQGTAVFNESFIAQPPTGDPAPDAWVERMRFWTAVHEMGHAFNLAHSWQKGLGTPWQASLGDEPEARSFMNYPYGVGGGQAAFFADFEFRFSDAELLFLRHAPEGFVQPGNADWFDHHGFEQAAAVEGADLRLHVRLHRERAELEFLEPLIVELKLENTGTTPVVVDRSVLARSEPLTVVIKRQGAPARQYHPYARYCREPQPMLLRPGRALYEPVTLFAGVNGWDAAEPGRYTVQVALHLDDQDVVSAPLHLVVRPPRNRTEEALAQDVLTEEVGRALVFEGTRVLTSANDALRDVCEQVPHARIALHARYALGAPAAGPTKRLEVDDGGPRITPVGPDDDAPEEVKTALLEQPQVAAETFGHILFRRRVEHLRDVLAEQERAEEAAIANDLLVDTLEQRSVLPGVLEEIRAAGERLHAVD